MVIDEGRIATFGFSQGGVVAERMAAEYPEPAAADLKLCEVTGHSFPPDYRDTWVKRVTAILAKRS